MQKRFVAAIALVIIALCIAPLWPAVRATQTATSAIAAEASRLKGILGALKVSTKEQDDYSIQLKQVEQALQAGYMLASLRQLQPLETTLVALEYQQSHSDVEQGGLDAFEREWQRLGLELKEKEKLLASEVARQLPLAVKGFLERSLTQVQPYYQSGRLYAQQTTVESGLFYLGLAKAHLEFALFCQSLHFAATMTAATLRSLAPELNEVEREILQAYRQPGAATQQNVFNRINSALKVAQDLERERRYSGALLQYLEVCRLLSSLNPQPAESLKPETLKYESDALRARLAGSKADHSIARLYWELAQAQASDQDANKRQAAVILHQVLPRYFKYMTRIKR